MIEYFSPEYFEDLDIGSKSETWQTMNLWAYLGYWVSKPFFFSDERIPGHGRLPKNWIVL